MEISALTIQNFRCFGSESVRIEISSLSTFIGANGAGKTAALHALLKLFGSTAERHLEKQDFFLPPSELDDDRDTASLVIEAEIVFPELEEEGADDSAIPDCFKQMMVRSEGEPPICRLRLEGTWHRTSSPEGDIDEAVFWVTTKESDPEPATKSRMSAGDRSFIQIIYVPATRDPAKQMRQVSSSIMYRLLRAIDWTDDVHTAIKEASDNLEAAFGGELGVSTLQEALSGSWQELHEFQNIAETTIRPVPGNFEDWLRKVEVCFHSEGGNVQHPPSRLSDGLRSLFYLALVASAFRVEEKVRFDDGSPGKKTGFSIEDMTLPSLTIFAVEEPENHLAPHYLGRIVRLLKEISESPYAQVVLSSQSPSILGRIAPESVRHFHLDRESMETRVREITLPDSEDETDAFKFIKEAVRAYPELYFATLVILGEGDSEELVLPRLARALGMDLDTRFVSIVPLGGRHVNHFWRLLTDLQIPFITLLDLDRERHGGGWQRIHYICEQLLAIGGDSDEVLNSDGGPLSDAEFEAMPEWEIGNGKGIADWAEAFEIFDVFFSSPLDLDFSMLMSFPNEYHQATTGTGPQIPTDGDKLEARMRAARRAVLKDKGGDGSSFTDKEKEQFVWYSYLFLGRGKPTTHLVALNSLSNISLRNRMPAVLKRLLKRVEAKLASAAG